MTRFLLKLTARWRYRRELLHFSRQEAEARAKHRPVKHIQLARREFQHACLRAKP